MTTVVEALERIARQCAVKQPNSWVTATGQEHVEVRDDFLRETVDDLVSRLDLPSPMGSTTTIAGDGSEAYNLPSDFMRLHRDPYAVYDSTAQRLCVPVVDDGQWEVIKDVGAAGVIRYYRVQGYDGAHTISFYNPPATGTSIIVKYATGKWCASGGTPKETFSDETDVLLYPRRVIETGTVWRFRERKGLPYLDKYNEYEALVARLSNDSRQRRTVIFGEPAPEAKWQDLIPAFIPPNA